MKLSAHVSVALVVAILAAIDCRPVGLVSSVPAISSSINTSKSQSSYSPQPTTAPSLEIVRDITAPFIDVPFIELMPLGDSDPIVEVPFKEPVTNPVQDHQETNPQLVRAVKPSAIGTCKPVNDTKCKAFRETDAFACSGTSLGVVCSTRDGSSCLDTAFNTCFEFTQTAGVYCSVAGCAQNL
ncbi:hypothetical protein HPULCUR_000591 [Helicostylum pulchrum]|uniref:Secreted protein n=1 Tax=Helicostylum pulchrum TaxID=562976 RepID=A0ABP9XKE6_9FUNG